MSYEEFRRRIDTMRQILVGAVPSPAGQIDQITYALMYKFMNDIDDQSAALGGVRTYFTGEYEKYNWHALMSSSLGAHERLELYRQAIQTMAKNENIPELFRSIYQNAFLPFNSANVLTLFLKEADKFSHGETDDIGDAYEYLLSITGAQGDVGQFRTPRHIIKFIVEAVNPTKDDKVLDPAVGTAGFLIAAYNHVLSQHDGKDEQGNTNHEKRLTADELDKIHHNYRGFDIDPTMVRTAKVNMYLHGFKTPDIINHDSLSSEEYWNDRYDVILANPPFMTPKGGIQPHKKFGISANRAEVLFVDYIASHLKPTGRAGIVVPEGIIFQSGKAYKELRKNLVENYLYAVVSLPAGVFQPYSGVKTSVLLFDKELAKQRDEILFVKVENDGFSLGAQRRKVTGDQFPEALEVIEKFKSGEEFASEFSHTVSRSEIAESGDYNLSGDRYKVTQSITTEFEVVELGEIADISTGNSAPQKEELFKNGKYPFVRTSDVGAVHLTDNLRKVRDYLSEEGIKGLRLFKKGTILFPKSGASTFLNHRAMLGMDAYVVSHLATISPDENKVLPKYLYNMLVRVDARDLTPDQAYPSLKSNDLKTIKIPLPPIEIQREIVAELDGYQKIIDAAKTIVQTYKPTIKINPEWKLALIGDIAEVMSGQSPDGKYYNETGEGTPFYQGKTEFTDKYLGEPKKWTTYVTRAAEKGDILMSVRAPVGPVNVATEGICIGRGLAAIRTKDTSSLSQGYLYEAVRSHESRFKEKASGSTFESINRKDIEGVKIPLPPIEIQHEIVAELEAEQQLIDANKKLIEIYQQKIKSKIAEVWGE